MNLQSQAKNETSRQTRSKLEPHRDAIIELRRKHWPYKQIAKWLNERGVQTTFTSVYRFCERTIARRPRSGSPSPLADQESQSKLFSITTPQTNHPTSTPTNQPPPAPQYRFKTDI